MGTTTTRRDPMVDPLSSAIISFTAMPLHPIVLPTVPLDCWPSSSPPPTSSASNHHPLPPCDRLIGNPPWAPVSPNHRYPLCPCRRPPPFSLIVLPILCHQEVADPAAHLTTSVDYFASIAHTALPSSSLSHRCFAILRHPQCRHESPAIIFPIRRSSRPPTTADTIAGLCSFPSSFSCSRSAHHLPPPLHHRPSPPPPPPSSLSSTISPSCRCQSWPPVDLLAISWLSAMAATPSSSHGIPSGHLLPLHLPFPSKPPAHPPWSTFPSPHQPRSTTTFPLLPPPIASHASPSHLRHHHLPITAIARPKPP